MKQIQLNEPFQVAGYMLYKAGTPLYGEELPNHSPRLRTLVVNHSQGDYLFMHNARPVYVKELPESPEEKWVWHVPTTYATITAVLE